MLAIDMHMGYQAVNSREPACQEDGRSPQVFSDRVMANEAAMARASVHEDELGELFTRLRKLPTFQSLREEDLPLLSGAVQVFLSAGEDLEAPAEAAFFALIEGKVEVSKYRGTERAIIVTVYGGETFGEVPLFLNTDGHLYDVTAMQPCVLVWFPTAAFWQLLADAPKVREAVLGDFSRRYQSHQAMTLHREKLISLGTLAAGLMHELNNPGAAAGRATKHLRENILRLQQISLRMTRTPLSGEQLECLASLQEQALSAPRLSSLSSLEVSDREEEMSGWLEEMGVENAWHLAPIMVGAGWQHEDISCARSSFPGAVFSDALNYLAALISSMQHVGTIEESIARVGELVGAVKKYAYDDKCRQMMDVRDGLQSTLTILGHKLREKQIHVDRDFPPDQILITCRGMGLAQVWTNLLDNAIDAAPEGGTVGVRLWTEGEQVCVGIADNGPGIPPEHRDHIFEAFYTTKEAGVGTGLGLNIAHRIVVEQFGGQLSFASRPGSTEFIVKLPIAQLSGTDGQSCAVSRI